MVERRELLIDSDEERNERTKRENLTNRA